MNCPECGIAVEKDASFCPKCYARIEPPGLWRRLLDFFKPKTGLDVRVVRSKETLTGSRDDSAVGTLSCFKTEVQIIHSAKPVLISMDKDGHRHEYHSLDEVPPDKRSMFEKLELEATREGDKLLSGDLQSPDKNPPGCIVREGQTIYKFKDDAGQEHTCHSPDELPPKIREALKLIKGFPGL